MKPRVEGVSEIRHTPQHLRATVAGLIGDQVKVEIHLDGGASTGLLCSTFCSELLKRNLAQVLGKPDHTVVLEAADGHELSVTHEVEVKFSLGSARLKWRFLAVENLANKMVLGLDFFVLAPAICDYQVQALRLPFHNATVVRV